MSNKDNNLTEEFFRLDLQIVDNYKKNKSKKLIKKAEKNIIRIFLDRLDGKSGEC